MNTARNQLDSMKAAGLTETVEYRPGSGRRRSIAVLVDRLGRQPGEGGGAARPEMTVTAIHDQRHGIDPTLIDTGTDHITVAEHAGGVATVRQIRRITAEDDDWVTVEVR